MWELRGAKAELGPCSQRCCARACQHRLKNHHAASVSANDNGILCMHCFEIFDPDRITPSFSKEQTSGNTVAEGGKCTMKVIEVAALQLFRAREMCAALLRSVCK
jgi:hypothetical protein